MSLSSILEYTRARPFGTQNTMAAIYGTENFGIFLYSLLRMEQPKVVVELGTGAATTTLLIAEALRENARGHVWSIDDGSDWSTLQGYCERAIGATYDETSYGTFLAHLAERFELASHITYVNQHLETDFYDPGDPVDIVFADATPADAEGCVNLLRYYLPRMSGYSSIFIDQASTINHSYLLLNYLVGQLDAGRIPLHLIAEMPDERQASIRALVEQSHFSIVHLTETNRNKWNRLENGRAWIRIEPNDYLPHNDVISVVTRSG